MNTDVHVCFCVSDYISILPGICPNKVNIFTCRQVSVAYVGLYEETCFHIKTAQHIDKNFNRASSTELSGEGSAALAPRGRSECAGSTRNSPSKRLRRPVEAPLQDECDQGRGAGFHKTGDAGRLRTHCQAQVDSTEIIAGNSSRAWV